jgi:hypothetical protein
MATRLFNGGKEPRRPSDRMLDNRFRQISMSNIIRFCTATIFILVCLLLNRPAPAQVSSASISGVVTDATGSVVPGATVTVKDLGTNRTRTAKTNAAGLYLVPNLAEGQYQVSVQMDGFATAINTGIPLTVGAARVQNIELKVGAISEQVEVTSENLAQVDSSTSQLGSLVDERQMRELPLNGRNFEQLVLLAPGVQPVTQGASNSNYGRAATYAVAGARPQGQSILLDGTDIQNFNNHGTGASIVGTSLGVNAISDFQVLTNTYSAEFGGSGTAINASTRAGNNQFHGEAYEFLRNSVFDAKNFFDNPKLSIPSFRRNQFGGSLGGPIKKDKAFFFLNYEGLRQQLGRTMISVVPNAYTHQGLLPVPCGPGTSYQCDQATGLANVGVNSSTAPLLALYPLPNVDTLSDGTGHLSAVANHPVTENYVMGRVDQTLGAKDSLFGRIVVDRATMIDPFPQAGFGGGVPLWPETNTAKNLYLTIEEKRVVSGTIINLARFSYTRTNFGAVDPSTTPAINVFPGEVRPDSIVNVTGLGRIGPGNVEPVMQIQNKFTYADSLYWTRGVHDMRMGFSVQRQQAKAAGAAFGGGIWTFPSLLALLTNKPSNLQGVLPGQANFIRYYQQLNFVGYFQDNWRILPKLTVNLGLRYEPTTNAEGSAAGGVSMTAVINPLTDTTFTAVTHVAGNNPSLRALDPRIGLAYSPSPKTVIRGGFGIFHDLLPTFLYNGGFGQQPPLTVGTQLNPVFPNAFQGSGVSVPKPSTAAPIEYLNQTTPYLIQYNLNVQRQITSDVVFTIGYVGTRGIHLLVSRDLNPVVAQTLADGRLYFPTSANRLNNNFGPLIQLGGAAKSNYNSLQLILNGRLMKSLQTQIYYTFSKQLDNASNSITGQALSGSPIQVNPYAIGPDYGLSSYDIRHSFSGNLMYDLPYQNNRWLGGFQFSTVISAHSGSPFSANVGYDVSNQGNQATQLRPDVVGDPNIAGPVALNPGCSAPTSIHSVQRWYNPCAFVVPLAGTLGNLGRNTLIGPGLVNVDMALSRRIQIKAVSEAFNIQLRAEAFNIFNHPNFGLPILNVFSQGRTLPTATAGNLTTTVTTSRQLQFSLKFVF